MSEIGLTADVVVFAPSPTAGEFHVLVIQRGAEPYAGQWALPGGYLEPGETFLEAARRELAEETGLAVAELERVDLYDAPDRDPRGRVITVAHVGLLPQPVPPTAGDDARAARWVPVTDLVSLHSLAFDHDEIVTAALARVAGSGSGDMASEPEAIELRGD